MLLDETSDILESELQLPYNRGSSTDEVPNCNPSSPNEALSFAANLLIIAKMLHDQCTNLENDQVDGKMVEIRQYLQKLARSISPPKESNTQTETVFTVEKKIQTDDLQQLLTTSIETQTDNIIKGKNKSTQCKVSASSKKSQTQTGDKSSIETQTDPTIAATTTPEVYIKNEPLQSSQTSQNTMLISEVINLVDYSDTEESETLSNIFQEVHRPIKSEEIQVTPDILIKDEPKDEGSIHVDVGESYFEKSQRTRLVLGEASKNITPNQPEPEKTPDEGMFVNLNCHFNFNLCIFVDSNKGRSDSESMLGEDGSDSDEISTGNFQNIQTVQISKQHNSPNHSR